MQNCRAYQKLRQNQKASRSSILSTRSVTPGEKLPNIPFQIPNAEMSS